MVSHTHWRVPASLRGTVNINHELSFFTRHGDLVGRSCVFVFLLLFLLLIFSLFLHKQKPTTP